MGLISTLGDNACTRIYHIREYLPCYGYTVTVNIMQGINTSRPIQNCCHFPGDIFKCIFLNENVWISVKISLKFVPKCPINNIPTLVQTMAWGRPGEKPLSEPIWVSLLTHICVTRSQWVKSDSGNQAGAMFHFDLITGVVKVLSRTDCRR